MKTQRINSQLLTVVYGSIVSQVIKDSTDLAEANHTLEKIGFNIGQRIVDQFMSKVSVCSQFDDIVQSFAKNGLKMFLGINGQIKDFTFKPETKQKPLSFYLILNENPLLNYVELPKQLEPLQYQNIICGILRGAFDTLNLSGRITVSRDSLKGNGQGKGSGQKTIIYVDMKKQIIKYGED